jgi:hypothetical protein
LEGEFLEREFAPFGLPVLWKGWDCFGDKETAISGETLEDSSLEGELERIEISLGMEKRWAKRSLRQ